MDGYLRVSRVGGRSGDRFLSPKDQRARIEAWAEAGKHKLGEVHEDLDQPGSRMERPGLTAALERVEAGAAEGIVVAKLDRFGRSVLHQAELIKRLRAAGGRLLTVAEGIDTGGPTGNLIASILGAIAEWELERIRENWQTAQTAALDRGVHVSGHTPAGYRRDEDGRLVVDPEIGPAISDVFGQRAQGASWTSLVNMLAERDIPTAAGSPRWTIQSLQSLVKNRVYLGEAKGAGLVRLGAHEALTDPATWTAANRPIPAPKGESGDYTGVLSGILRCAGCSYALQVRYGQTRQGRKRRQYRCIPRKSAGKCPAPASVTAELVEEVVVERFFGEAGKAQAKAQNLTAERRELETSIEMARGELEAVLDRRLVEALGGPEAEAYIETVRMRREHLEELESRLASLDDGAVALPDPARLRDVWEEWTLHERRAAIRSVFGAVFLRRTRFVGESTADRLRFFEPIDLPDLPTRGVRGVIRSIEID